MYKLGCRGPVTYNACGTVGWNGGVGFPIKSGNPCIGCSESGFWDNGPFVERLTNVSGGEIESTADKIGKILLGVTAGAAVVHGVAANIAKKKELREGLNRGIENAEKIDHKLND